MWKNTVQPDRPYDNIIRRMRFDRWITEATHTFRICNTSCFSTATTVSQTHLIVTLHVYCLDWVDSLLLVLDAVYTCIRPYIRKLCSHYNSSSRFHFLSPTNSRHCLNKSIRSNQGKFPSIEHINSRLSISLKFSYPCRPTLLDRVQTDKYRALYTRRLTIDSWRRSHIWGI